VLAQFARHKCRFNYTLSAVWISHTWANAISPLLGDLLFAIRRQTRKSVFLRKGVDENSFVLLNLLIVAFNEYLSSAAAALHGDIILHLNLGSYYWFQRFAKKLKRD
jgi:CBS domain containing-hemolysin-like protein